MKERNASIELYRVALMLGITILHAAYVSSGTSHWLNTGLQWCVDGFVFITGYFGCRFDRKKVVRLYATAFWCGLVVVAGWCLFSHMEICDQHWLESIGFGDIPKWGAVGFVREWVRSLRDPWFLNAYVLMLCLVPIVNCALDCAFSRGGADLASLFHSLSRYSDGALPWNCQFCIGGFRVPMVSGRIRP